MDPNESFWPDQGSIEQDKQIRRTRSLIASAVHNLDPVLVPSWRRQELFTPEYFSESFGIPYYLIASTCRLEDDDMMEVVRRPSLSKPFKAYKQCEEERPAHLSHLPVAMGFNWRGWAKHVVMWPHVGILPNKTYIAVFLNGTQYCFTPLKNWVSGG